MPSSVIASYSYQENDAQLEIRFVSGLVYTYSKVPKAIFERMQKSKSKGIFFNKVIKGNYAFERKD